MSFKKSTGSPRREPGGGAHTSMGRTRRKGALAWMAGVAALALTLTPGLTWADDEVTPEPAEVVMPAIMALDSDEAVAEEPTAEAVAEETQAEDHESDTPSVPAETEPAEAETPEVVPDETGTEGTASPDSTTGSEGSASEEGDGSSEPVSPPASPEATDTTSDEGAAAEEELAAAEEDLIAPMAVNCTTSRTTSCITVRKGGIRTGNTSVSGLAGAEFRVYSGNASGPTGNSLDSCTTGTNGTCQLQVSPSPDGSQYWLVEQSAPSGWTKVEQLYVGGSANSMSNTAYQIRTNTIRRNQTYTYPQESTGFSTTKASGGVWPNIAVNPTAFQQCGLRVGLLVDLSNSISNDDLDDLKNATTSFVDTLQGTPSSVAIWTFATAAPAAGASNVARPLTSVSTPAGANQVKGWLNGLTLPGGAAGGTNWDMGLWRVAQASAANTVDILLVLTDGTPTYYGDPVDGPGNWSRFREMESAIFSANAVKLNKGTRVVAVGVGDATTAVENLKAISGPSVNNDYFMVSNYAALGAMLEELAKGQCDGTVNVTKMLVPPTGGLDDATPEPGWGFSASTTASGVTLTPTQGQTNQSGGISFKADGLPVNGSAPVTVVEEDRAGFDLVQQDGLNATCRDDAGAVVPTTNNGDFGFNTTATAGKIVSCVVYNREPTPRVGLRVEKEWVINGVSYSNGEQPADFEAGLTLDGADRNFSTVYTYDVGARVAIDETVTVPTYCTNTAQGTGTHTVTATPNPNVVTLTNTVTCTTQLTLIKDVVNGDANPTDWTLTATPPTGGGHLAGPSGTSGATADITPGISYTLAESGDARYIQEVVPNAVLIPGATGSWRCYELDADGQRVGAAYDGLNGGVTVDLGEHVECEARNMTAELSLLKEVQNSHGGDLESSDWDLTSTPAPMNGLEASTVTGNSTVTAANTVFVRPGHVYTLTESSQPGYEFRKLQVLVDEEWVDVVAAPGDGYPRQDANGNWQVTVEALESGVYRFVNVDTPPTLTLVKEVAFGSEPASTWDLSATGTPESAPGPSGKTGVSAEITANSGYVLAEDGGPATYVPTEDGWTCVADEGEATLTVEDGQSSVSALPGQDVTCTITNTTAMLTVYKDVEGSAASSNWTISGTPETFEGLGDAQWPGTASPEGTPANTDGLTLEVRPGHTYTLSEAITASGASLNYLLQTVQVWNGEAWVDVEADDLDAIPVTVPGGESAHYRFINAEVAGPALPSTGGIGRDHIYIAGASVLLLAAAGYGTMRIRARRNGIA